MASRVDTMREGYLESWTQWEKLADINLCDLSPAKSTSSIQELSVILAKGELA